MSQHQSISLDSSKNHATKDVRRNLFYQHLSRRPSVTEKINVSVETLKKDSQPEFDDSLDIVIRDENGEFQIGGVVAIPSPFQSFYDEEAGQHQPRENENDRQRLIDAIRNHQRGRNRAPSEPAELLEAVRIRLKAKVAALIEDNWLYEAGDGNTAR